MRWLREAIGEGRRGSLTLTAVLMVAALAVMALGIDLAMAFTARGEAQRVADSSALAGASAFLDFQDPTEAVGTARDRLYEFARCNVVRNKLVDSSEVSYEILPEKRRVTVWISRQGIGTWFAGLFGIKTLGVQAIAAAEVSIEGSTVSGECPLPFALPDLWADSDDDTSLDHVPNAQEDWEFEPGDEYHPYAADPPSGYGDYQETHGTGFGSDLRGAGGDYGRRFWIKAGPTGQSGKGGGGPPGGLDEMVVPGSFFAWALPSEANECHALDTPRGMPWVEENIARCNPCDLNVGVPYGTEPGNKAALKDEMEALIDRDRNAYWDDGCNCIRGSRFGDHQSAVEHSPRVRVIALWDPRTGFGMHGREEIVFNNFARVFVEGGGMEPPEFQIYGRFLGRVSGYGKPPDDGGGTLISHLRLVK